MEETLEYWQEVLDQHQKHIDIALTKSEINDNDLKNAKLAIEEAKLKIEELS